MRTKPLPPRPEAVIPGTPFGIEVLKGVLALGFLVSIIGSIPGLPSVLFSHLQYIPSHSLFNQMLSVIYAAAFGAAFYGVHRRMRAAWKIGWLYLSFFYLDAIVSAAFGSGQDHNAPGTDRWVMLVSIVVVFSVVAVYWGRWWNKQKKYFVN